MFRHKDRDRAANDLDRDSEIESFDGGARPYSSSTDDRIAPGAAGGVEVSDARDMLRSGFAPNRESTSGQQESQGTIIGRGASFTGTLSGDGPVTIIGTLEGEIIAAGDVTIAREAIVRARIQAITLQVAGRFNGSVACTHRFEVLETGRVEADILAPAIVVHEGATINGRFRIRDNGETAEPVDAPADAEGETGGSEFSGFEGSE